VSPGPGGGPRDGRRSGPDLHERALPLYEEALQRNPGFDRGHLQVAAIYGQLGETDDAAWALEEALAIRPDITLAGERQGARYQRSEDTARYIDGLRKAGLPE